MLMREFFKKYKYIDVVESSGWSDINEMIRTINQGNKQDKGVQNRYEYPLGNKNFISMNFHSKHCFIMKEKGIVKGVATISIQDIFLEGKLKRVAYLSDLKIASDFCTTGKREWRSAFQDIITNKDRINELKECEFIYGLIDEENDATKNLFSRFDKTVTMTELKQYSIHNIFTKKSEIDFPSNNIEIRLSKHQDIDKIKKLSITEMQKSNWCDSPKQIINDIERYIQNGQSIVVLKDGEIVSHAAFIRTKIDKVELEDISSKFKMAKSLLPLFSTGLPNSSEGIEKLNSIYLTQLCIKHDLEPKERVEICQTIIQAIINGRHQQKESILTISTIKDRAIDKALESFISITKEMNMISFLKKEEMAIEDINDLDYEKVS